ncbi:MAG: IclR family transcriptional regulator [Lachnospiraceae bacterium]|nr:IclR family transcriptional regulator [Lachnospiraceae bacterium]
MEKTNGGEMKTVRKALEILELMLDYQKEIGITEMAAMIGINKSTVCKIMLVLQEYGYVVKNPLTSKYHLGNKFITFSTKVMSEMKIRDVAKPYIDKLAEITGETINLAIISGTKTMYIEVVNSGENVVQISNQIGKLENMHCTSVGKALLAFSPKEFVDEVLATEGLPPVNENTITSAEVFLAELEEVRRRGYAIDERESLPDVMCVGAPILDYSGMAIASISISGYVGRLNEEKWNEFCRIIVNTAKKISAQIGGTGY